jgi:thiamine pyrophosphate-dependent acetolactate synthase large subunit-like protein
MLNSLCDSNMVVREAFIRFLAAKGVEFIFHLPGLHTLPLNDAFSRSNIRVIMGRHESSAGFMADGFSRATGKAGIVLVTPGPGLGNLVSSCMEAFADDVSLVIVVVDVGREDVGKGVLHGVPFPEAPFSHITKRIYSITDEKDLWSKLNDAYLLATTPRTGPVLVSIAYRLLDRECPPPSSTTGGAEAVLPLHPSFDPHVLEEALEGKKRPVIIAGRALMESAPGPRFADLCRASGIPVLTTTSGKGALRDDHPWAFGAVTGKGVAREVLASADLVLAVGTRLRDVDAKRRGVKIANLVHCDVDERWMCKNYKASRVLVGEMKSVVEALHRTLANRKFSWSRERLDGARQKERVAMERDHIGFRIVQLLRRLIPENTTTVWDLSMLGYWAESWFPVYRERSFLFPRGISPIFYGLPAAIGAAIGRRDCPCLCVTGDGSFLPTVSELATIRQYGIPIVILVYNNGAFGVLEEYMRRRYGKDGSMDLFNPDLVALARSFDVKAERATDHARLESIFRRMAKWDEPFLVELSHPLLSLPW